MTHGESPNTPGRLARLRIAVGKRLRRRITKTLPIRFSLDRTPDDRHLVRVYTLINDQERLIANPRELTRYGYCEVHETPEEVITYVLDVADLQTLLALQSMNPVQDDNGGLTFYIAPPILHHLRQISSVDESSASRQVEVSDKPLQPAADVDFDPAAGITIRTGYRAPTGGRLMPIDNLRTTSDGRFAWVDSTVFPIGKLTGSRVTKWMSRPVHHVAIDDVPEFYIRDLGLLKKEMAAAPTGRMRELRVLNEPLQPTANVDFDPAAGITIQTGYRIPGSDRLMPESELHTTSDGRFAWVGSTAIPYKRPTGTFFTRWMSSSVHHVAIDDVPEFYIRDLAPLRKELAAVLTDRVRELRVLDEPLKPIVYLDRNEKGWLDFNIRYDLGERTISHSQLSSTAGQPFIRLNDHTWSRLDRRAIQSNHAELKKLGATLTLDGGYRVSATEFATLEEFVSSIGGKPIISSRYQNFIDELTGFRADDTFRLSTATEAHLASRRVTLYPYQRAGVHWLTWLHDNQLHGLLADDMGLGKTLQSILTLRHAYEADGSQLPSLVIAPASVMFHWEREFERYLPEMNVYRYHGPGRSLRPLQSARPIIAVSTYDTVRSSIEKLAKVPFFYVVLDEATNIKNPTSSRSKAVKALNSAHRISLSGTPVENRPAELWSIYDFLMSGHLGAYGTFERVFESQIIAGSQGAAERLGRRIRPFMLRRLKEEVARDLPEKIEMDEWCTLTTEQATMYNEIQSEAEPILASLKAGGRIEYTKSLLPILTKLKQVCDHPAIVNKIEDPLAGRSEKFDWVVERVQSIVDGGEQVLVFSHFLGMLNLLEQAVKARGLTYIRLDGSTSNRQELIDRFNAGRVKVGLFSIRAAGHGITVTAANHVIHADRWWNPAVENQATDRVHRIGQTKTVYVYRIMVENTLEERIEKLLQRKQQIADQVIGAARQEHQWTREELLEILRPL